MDILIALYKIEFTMFIISFKLHHPLTGQMPPGLYLWHQLVGTGVWNWSNTLTLTPVIARSCRFTFVFAPEIVCLYQQQEHSGRLTRYLLTG